MTYNKEYYEKHKEQYKESSKKWRQANKEQYNKICYECRRKNAEKRRQNGEMFVWTYGKERERLINARINRTNRQRTNKDTINEERQDYQN